MPVINPGDAHYEHDQGVPALVWTCNHGMGKHPSVTIVDTTKREIYAQVEHVSFTQTKITFAVPTSGKAYFN
jgi:hypothetical protein